MVWCHTPKVLIGGLIADLIENQKQAASFGPLGFISYEDLSGQ
jgi:hypothetical protein